MSTPMFSLTGLLAAALLGGAPVPTHLAAAHPGQRVIDFEYTHDTGFGNSLYLVGEHPALGGGDPARGIKLRWTPGNTWTANVAVPYAQTPLPFRYVSRATGADVICDSTNATDIATGLTVAPGETLNAPAAGKTVDYLSSWSRVELLYRAADDTFTTVAMTPVGPGRAPAETLWRATGIGTFGEDLEFVFTNGEGAWDNAFGQPGQNYLTPLDFLRVQDGNVYNYQPAPSVSPPRIERHTLTSTINGIAARDIQIYLPRGYDEHTARSYPVLYLHDGQNVFDPGGTFGSWSADATATTEIQMGRMRETLIVAIDNTSARLTEYLPPTESLPGLGITIGQGDAYAQFVLGDVRTFIDANYRTLTAAEDTALMGSSFGGIITAYMGWEHADAFGKLGVLSPAWWAVPNLLDSLNGRPARSERIYLYWGTEESSGSADSSLWWPPFLEGYDLYLSQGYAINGNYRAEIGCGQAHNEAAWAAFLPGALRFLLDIRDEANALTYTAARPRLRLNRDGDALKLSFHAFKDFTYTVEERLGGGTATAPWQTLTPTARTDHWWEPSSLVHPLPTDPDRSIFRVRATAP